MICSRGKARNGYHNRCEQTEYASEKELETSERGLSRDVDDVSTIRRTMTEGGPVENLTLSRLGMEIERTTPAPCTVRRVEHLEHQLFI
jgi:hypothetical protein